MRLRSIIRLDDIRIYIRVYNYVGCIGYSLYVYARMLVVARNRGKWITTRRRRFFPRVLVTSVECSYGIFPRMWRRKDFKKCRFPTTARGGFKRSIATDAEECCWLILRYLRNVFTVSWNFKGGEISLVKIGNEFELIFNQKRGKEIDTTTFMQKNLRNDSVDIFYWWKYNNQA